ncbi:MAG: Asp/Glu racemase, partial [Pseudomonadota bacterium]
MSRPYTLVDTPYSMGCLGLIALQTDETLENELRQVFVDPRTALYVSRVPSAQTLTPESIAQMGKDLPQATALLPPLPAYDAVAYGCTSGTTLIGPQEVQRLVAAECATAHVTNPLSAAIAALQALGVGRIGLVSPYTPDIAQPVEDAFVAAGFSVARALTFGEAQEAHVARIAPNSLAQAAHEVAGDGVGCAGWCRTKTPPLPHL